MDKLLVGIIIGLTFLDGHLKTSKALKIHIAFDPTILLLGNLTK